MTDVSGLTEEAARWRTLAVDATPIHYVCLITVNAILTDLLALWSRVDNTTYYYYY